MCKFEGNLIPRLCFMAVFASEEEKKKISNFLFQIWYAFSPDMPAPAQQIWSGSDKRSQSYEGTYNRTLFFILICSHFVRMPYFLGSPVCLDSSGDIHYVLYSIRISHTCIYIVITRIKCTVRTGCMQYTTDYKI